MTDPANTSGLEPPATGEAVLPLPRKISPARWVYRGCLWTALLAIFVLLLRYDVTVMQWSIDLFGPPDKIDGWARQILYGLRDFGQVVPIVVAMIIVWRYDRRRKTIVFCILLAELLANIGYNPPKFLLVRYRPRYAIEDFGSLQAYAATHRVLTWSPWVRSEKFRSFPSGHSAGAFAFAGVLVWFYPRLRATFWTLAAGCAASRVIDQVHWPGDIFTGACIGYASAWLALRPSAWLPAAWFRRLRAGSGAFPVHEA